MHTDIDKAGIYYRLQPYGAKTTLAANTRGWSNWYGVPFLLAAFIQGIPIAGGVQEQSERFAEEIYKTTQARATTLGYENTIILVLFWTALYVLAGMTVWRTLRPKTLLRFWPFLSIIIVMAIGIAWTPYPGKVAMNIVHNVGVFAIAYGAAYRYRQDSRLLLAHLGMVLGLNLLIQSAAIAVMPAVAIQWDGRWCGFTSNANTLGYIGFIALWANSATVAFTSKGKRAIHLGFCLMALMILAGSHSMTSILCTLMAVGGTYLMKVYRRPSHQYRSIKPAWISLALLASAFSILLAFSIEPAEWFALLGRSSDFSGRQFIWQSALDLISHAPIFGYGFDDNAYANQLSGLPQSTYHNGFLDLAVRGGLVSLFLLLLLFARGYDRFKKTRNLPIFFVTSFLPFALSSILYNMTEVSFFAARNLLWITLLIAIITPEISISQYYSSYQPNKRN